MAYTLGNHTSAGSTGGTTITTTGIDTAGASLLIVGLTEYRVGTGTTLSDNYLNNWTRLTPQDDGTWTITSLYYAKNAIVGSGHTFTATPNTTVTYPTIEVAAFAAADSSQFDVQNGNTTVGAGSLQTGSVTPGVNDELIVTAIGSAGTMGTLAIDSSFTLLEQVVFSGGDHWHGGFAYLTQGSASAVNPTWSWSPIQYASTAIGTFKLVAMLPESSDPDCTEESWETMPY